MSDRAAPLRLIRARWCLLAAAQPVLAAAGAPLPFRVTVDGGERGVARYDASSTAGATLVWFGPERAVLSCGDLGWRVPGAAGPADWVDGGPSWLEHVAMLDHRVSAGRYAWTGELFSWRSDYSPRLDQDGKAVVGGELLRRVDEDFSRFVERTATDLDRLDRAPWMRSSDD